MKFLVDAQLPPALVQWLSGEGHEATHVEDEGLLDAEDGPGMVLRAPKWRSNPD